MQHHQQNSPVYGCIAPLDSFGDAIANRKHRMTQEWARALIAVFFLLAAAVIPAAAGTVTGTVLNGTSGKPAPGVDVILIQLQGGMQSVANTKTDSAGKYKLENPGVGQQPMLIRAIYKNVMFHQPLTPGHDTADVTVYEPTSDAHTVNVGSRLIVFQPNNSTLLVGEEYALQNQSHPPVAYYNQQGDFSFNVPEGAQLSDVSSWGPSGMPVVQGTINKGPQKYAIAYAFQPGDNGVRFSYQVPYTGNQAKLRFTSDYAVGRVMLVAPPTVQVKSDGFSPAGTEQGFNLYSRDGMPAGLPFDVTVSGTAPPPSQSQAQGGDPGAGQGQDQVNGRDSGPAIQTLPNRLDSMKWIVIGGFVALFALGFFFVWRKPGGLMTAPAAAGPIPGTGLSRGESRRLRKQQMQGSQPSQQAAQPAQNSAATMPSASSASNAVAELDRDVERNLDSLKDKLFRLELRHQAGTISEEEYARERSRTEQILRELVRG